MRTIRAVCKFFVPSYRNVVWARPTTLQAPEEFTIAVATSVTILSAVLVLPTLHKNLEGERDERRRAMLVASLLTSLAIVAPPLWGPLKGFVLADDAKMEAGCVCVLGCGIESPCLLYVESSHIYYGNIV